MKKNLSIIILIYFIFSPVIYSSCKQQFKLAYSVSDIELINVQDGNIDNKKNFLPDGKICVVKEGDKYKMFWAGQKYNFNTESSSSNIKDFFAEKDFGETSVGDVFLKNSDLTDAGIWFIGVYDLNDIDSTKPDGTYIGFYHAASKWNNNPDICYKSLGVCYNEEGKFGKQYKWGFPFPIIVDKYPKPADPAWSGVGDGTVIWDKQNKRWICYYQAKVADGLGLFEENYLCMASSGDPEAGSGSWKKWDGFDFTIDAYNSETKTGGENIPIAGLKNVAGCNPSVIWNDYLNMWVMVYSSWQKKLYMSFSYDAIVWSDPEPLFEGKSFTQSYPNLMGDDDDKVAGKDMKLYFAHNQNPTNGMRNLAFCTISFE